MKNLLILGEPEVRCQDLRNNELAYSLPFHEGGEANFGSYFDN